MCHQPVLLLSIKNMFKQKNKKNAGFTLIEVIVAVIVLMIGVLGISFFFANSSHLTRLASNTSIASNLDQGLIEQEKAKSYGELTVGNGSVQPVSTDTTSPFSKFTKQINISLVDSNLNPSSTDIGLKKIDCFIYWQEGTEQRNVSMSTLEINQ